MFENVDEYSDRFRPETYTNDPVFVVGLLRDTAVDERAFIPERLFIRIRAIASAYYLHVLPGIDADYGRATVNAVQCEGLVGELEFVQQVSDDPLLASHAQRLSDIATECVRTRQTLVVEGPG